jgi:hypothetical protein
MLDRLADRRCSVIFNRQCAGARARHAEATYRARALCACTLPCRSRSLQSVRFTPTDLGLPSCSADGVNHSKLQQFACCLTWRVSHEHSPSLVVSCFAAHGRDSQQELSCSSCFLRPTYTIRQRSDRIRKLSVPAQNHLHQVCRISCTIDGKSKGSHWRRASNAALLYAVQGSVAVCKPQSPNF